MEAEVLIQLIAIMLPLAEKAGLDIYMIISGLHEEKDIDTIINEAQMKKNDLPDYPFEP